MTSTHEKLVELGLYVDLEERLLICCGAECKYALSVDRSQVTSHLRDRHNVLLDLQRGITYILKHEYAGFFCNPVEVVECDDGALIHNKLHLYVRRLRLR